MRSPIDYGAEQVLWALSERHVTHGCRVGISAEGAEHETALARLTEAMDLLQTSGPRWLRQMHRYVARIQVGVIEAAGQWQRASRQVAIDIGYLNSPDRTAPDVAATIVHECTHARLEAMGIPYSRILRIRIEQTCVRQELIFLRGLPETSPIESLIAGRESQLRNAAEAWSDEELDRLARRAAQAVGMPARLTEWLLAIRRWRRRWQR